MGKESFVKFTYEILSSATSKILFFTMQLKKFTLPKTDERLITIDNTIFKIKIILVKEPKRNEKRCLFCFQMKIVLYKKLLKLNMHELFYK